VKKSKKSPLKTTNTNSNISVEKLNSFQNILIPDICAKLALINSQVGTIDKAFTQRAQTIDETLTVVQEEMSKMS